MSIKLEMRLWGRELSFKLRLTHTPMLCDLGQPLNLSHASVSSSNGTLHVQLKKPTSSKINVFNKMGITEVSSQRVPLSIE